MTESSHSNLIGLEPEWKKVMADEFAQPYMLELKKFLQEQKSLGKVIFPPGSQIFNAFNLTPFSKVKVVILGQDPYHGDHQAHGLSFSVQKGIRPPPSLLNIYKELESDVGVKQPQHGCLDSWSKAGVLLLNSVLTVEKAKPASHQNKGWEKFTDAAIKHLSDQRSHLVFILCGAYAQAKSVLIDPTKHLVLCSAHPSPFSANRGFLGSKPFSQTNEYLKAQHLDPIDWSL